MVDDWMGVSQLIEKGALLNQLGTVNFGFVIAEAEIVHHAWGNV